MRFLSLLSCYFAAVVSCSYARSDVKLQNYEDVDTVGDTFHTSGNAGEISIEGFHRFERPKIDPLQEDDHEEMNFDGIISLSRTKISRSLDKYSNIEKMVFVDLHNIYRSNLTKPIPKGSDLQYVMWNTTLEKNAHQYLKQCTLHHGWDRNDKMKDLQGQNLYKGSSSDPSRVLWMWYNEYKWYSFANSSCKHPYPKYECGHFTQMLWYDSRKIGCAQRSYCFPKDMSQKLVNCHYYHYGNAKSPGMQMYRVGNPCTRCQVSDGNLCYHNLCIEKGTCDAAKLDCECKLACKNCVKGDLKTCRCGHCKSGWDWEDCSHPCLNAFDVDTQLFGACKKSMLTSRVCQNRRIRNMCRMRCGACKALNASAEPAKVCCGGKMCPLYHTLDDSCMCKLDCPSPQCMFSENKTSNGLSPNKTEEPVTDNFPSRKKVKISSGVPHCSSINIYLIEIGVVIISVYGILYVV